MILIELWESENAEIRVHVDDSRKALRASALRTYLKRQLRDASSVLASGQDLSPEEADKVEQQCVATVLAGLHALGHTKLKASDLRGYLTEDTSQDDVDTETADTETEGTSGSED